MKLEVNLGINSYPIYIEKGAINHISDYIPNHGKVLIVSDDLIPEEYISIVAKSFDNSFIKRIKHGEDNKNLETYEEILSSLAELEFSRKDSIIALGGGLTSDIAGFAASSYMRGISFYIIPTTLLSQVDASIGGKVAVNFQGTKNLIGAFYQPKAVVIDLDTLKTLDNRLVLEGLAEAIKMSMTSNKELFEFIENNDALENIGEVIYESLLIKKGVIEQDEKESGLRQILNFGHTVGHAIEALGEGKYYHGEAVAIGMTYFSNKDVKDRLIEVLKKYNLPYKDIYNVKDIINKIKLDKKKSDDEHINVIKVDEIGSSKIERITFKELEEIIGGVKNEK